MSKFLFNSAAEELEKIRIQAIGAENVKKQEYNFTDNCLIIFSSIFLALHLLYFWNDANIWNVLKLISYKPLFYDVLQVNNLTSTISLFLYVAFEAVLSAIFCLIPVGILEDYLNNKLKNKEQKLITCTNITILSLWFFCIVLFIITRFN